MSESRIYPVPAEAAARAHATDEQYQAMYQRSIDDPEEFWSEQADALVDWFEKWDRVWEHDYTSATIKWFDGAKLNVAHNCLDRHLATRGDQVAIIWEGDDPSVEQEHHLPRAPCEEVCRLGQRPEGTWGQEGRQGVRFIIPMMPGGGGTRCWLAHV